ncbi:MAG: hypothetical protein SWQ30_20085 [Thermodesulfobacteriota bacterium]|nr:hypothetical protein [Thermodesulfobacteriota bacterium]
MSKHMQLTVRVRPYYKKGFGEVYPLIAKRLSYLDATWVEKDPSLFEIVGRLDKLLYQLEGDPPFRKILLDHRGKLHELYEDIQEQIADWHLAQADKHLYTMEDIFDEVERELGKI